MDRMPKTKDEIERLIVADLQSFLDCERALRVVVVPLIDHTHGGTWTVSCFNAGGSDGAACDRALQHIVPRFQRVYELVCKH